VRYPCKRHFGDKMVGRAAQRRQNPKLLIGRAGRLTLAKIRYHAGTRKV
jgi:hypothetical protein